MTIDVAATIEVAANHIERCGWRQGDYGNLRGSSTCAEGAILTTSSSAYRGLATIALQQWVGGCVPNWNDAPGQTKENVIATMRACAAIWRAKHEEQTVTRSAVPALGVESELAR